MVTARALTSCLAQIVVTVGAKITTDSGATASSTTSASDKRNINNGIDVYNANRVWQHIGSLADGANLVVDVHDFAGIDIGAGAGNDIHGQPMALDEIVLIMIENTTPQTGSESSDSDGETLLEVEPDSTAGWSPIGVNTGAAGLGHRALLVRLNDYNGFAVVDGVSHRVKLTAVNGSATYRITVIGRDLS